MRGPELGGGYPALDEAGPGWMPGHIWQWLADLLVAHGQAWRPEVPAR